MPLLNHARRTSLTGGVESLDLPVESGWMGRCSNSGCRSGWLQLFRSRTRPVFEGGWTCSPDCTKARLQLAVRREFDGWTRNPEPHRHRIPLGLLMLEKGWITPQQLRGAIEAQRKSGRLRIGEWLVEQGATTEALVARALSLQWACPVLSFSETGLTTTSELLPRLFVEAFGAIPMGDSFGRNLYLGFEQSVDKALTFSVERMMGVRVESGIVPSSAYSEALARIRKQAQAGIQVAEAASDNAAAHLLAKSIERARPCRSRLVRVHDWLWLRMVLIEQNAPIPECANIQDVVCRIGSF